MSLVEFNKKTGRKKTGRPTIDTPELKEKFLTLLTEGSRLREACEACGITKQTILKWLNNDSVFSAHYAHAREIYIDHFIEEIVEASENTPENKVSVMKQRLICDVKLRLLEMVFPKKYGRYAGQIEIGTAQNFTQIINFEYINRVSLAEKMEENREIQGESQRGIEVKKIETEM